MPSVELLRTERGEFEALVSGPKDGPVVMLLHGFPQLNVMWVPHIRHLAQAGYRVLAPNQRGYGASPRTGSFATADLAADIVSLLDAVDAPQAAVVGHDWGGAVAWTLAGRYPRRVSAMVALACPPPAVLAHAMKTSLGQLRRSWYMGLFMVPGVAERLLAGRIPGVIIRGSKNRDVWNRETLAPYADAFASPADLTGPLDWYRAMLRRSPASRPRSQPIAAPVRIIWGADDPVMGHRLIEPEALAGSLATGSTADIVELDEVGHFVVDEAPEEVGEAILDWLGAHWPPLPTMHA